MRMRAPSTPVDRTIATPPAIATGGTSPQSRRHAPPKPVAGETGVSRNRTLNPPLLLLLFIVPLLLIGCAGPRYRAVDYEAALARAKADRAYTDPTSRKNSLASFDVLTLGSLVPDPWSVREAAQNVEANASGNPGQLAGAVSLATFESTRRYLGDTFERAYASFVGSIAYWMTGEDDNAAALWRNAVDIDRESDDGYQTDFAVTHYLLAKYYWNQPGQRDNAEIYFRNALDAFPTNPYLTADRLENDNLVVFVEVGDGPRKTTSGPQGSMLAWEPGPSSGGAATISVDNGRIVGTAPILELMVQAEHSMRPTGKEVLQAAKGTAVAAGVGYGVYKLTDDPVLGILAALFLQLMPADTRQWYGVPAQVQMATFRVEPGRHTLRIRTSTHTDYFLAAQETVIDDVEVKSHRDTLVLIRPLRMMTERHALPPPGLPERGIVADEKALAAPGSPILDVGSLERRLRKRSPLYKYLPSREEIQTAPGPDPGAGDFDASPQP